MAGQDHWRCTWPGAAHRRRRASAGPVDGLRRGTTRLPGAIAKEEKIRIQQTFRQKAKAARDGIQLCGDGQDWSGVEAIVEAILAAFD